MSKQNGQRRSLIPVQVKWEEAGDKVEGLLVTKAKTMYRDQQRGRYLIKASDDLRVVLGTYQIDQAMDMIDEGAYIGIEFLGEEGTGSGNKIKLFDIWVDDAQAVDLDTGEMAEAPAD